MAHQSLYRRYRSRRFSELRGQDHVTTALRTAIETDGYGHAYLFSGPRGTGKTSTARILAKALNCENVVDGEPCCECDSCIAIENGKSFDLYELDAASHNKVDDVRDLIAKVHLGSPGRTKVYILDEVHMLSSGAENALLKTLEEPPDHVVFVLATTEPHKVVATIRSRTQHFTFNLLPADELAEHVRFVIEDAGLDVGDDAVDYALRQGGGSARDTLSALDLVAAAGGVPAGSDVGTELTQAVGAKDAERAIAIIQEGLVNGQEPRVIGETTVEVMRNAFLATMGASLDHLHDTARATATDLASTLGPATLTTAMEALGRCLVEMRQAPDPRVPLEVTVLGLCRSAAASPSPAAGGGGDASAASAGAGSAEVAALTSRVAELERTVAELTTALAAGASAAPAAVPVQPAPTNQAPASGPASGARAKLAEVTGGPSAPPPPRRRRPTGTSTPATQTPATQAPPAQAPAQQTPDETPTPVAPVTTGDPLQTGVVTTAWGDVLEQVSKGTRARFKGHEIMSASESTVTLGVPNAITADRCSDRKGEVEQALSAHFGRPVTLDIVVAENRQAPTDPAKIDPQPAPIHHEADDDIGPVHELEDAGDQSNNSIDRLTKAFPGSKVIEQTDG